MSMNPPHRPVLLANAIAALAIQAEGVYVDATFGRGGHTAAILNALSANGRLLALDRDPAAEQAAQNRFASDPRFCFVRANFDQLHSVLQSAGIAHIQGLLIDCGVSSPQLDDASRGFSFQKNAHLDMRMDPDAGISASAWLAQISEQELAQVLHQFGEERYHRRIARAIVKTRANKAITHTLQLAEVVAAAIPKWEPHKHPATRTFQAIRIVVNNELQALEKILQQAIDVLAPGGRLAVIAFHSLEDRLVKRFMRTQARGHTANLPAELPIKQQDSGATLRLIGRAQRAGGVELQINPRARSAVLRVAERLS